MGSIRLKVLENWTAGLTGWLYLRGSCAPADYACPDLASAERSTLLPNLVALSDQYRTTQRRMPLVPYSARDPPVSLPYASDSARSPEGKSGTLPGDTMRRDHNVPHVLLSFLCCRACQSPRLCPFGRVSFRWVGSRVKGSSQLKTISKRSRC